MFKPGTTESNCESAKFSSGYQSEVSRQREEIEFLKQRQLHSYVSDQGTSVPLLTEKMSSKSGMGWHALAKATSLTPGRVGTLSPARAELPSQPALVSRLVAAEIASIPVGRLVGNAVLPITWHVSAQVRRGVVEPIRKDANTNQT
jgi:hypothetical protein